MQRKRAWKKRLLQQPALSTPNSVCMLIEKFYGRMIFIVDFLWFVICLSNVACWLACAQEEKTWR